MPDMVAQWLQDLCSTQQAIARPAQEKLQEQGVAVLPQLLDILRHGRGEGPGRAGWLLARIGEPALGGLLEVLRDANLPTVREAAWALADFPLTSPVSKALVALLFHGDREVGHAAACAELPPSSEVLLGWLGVAAAWKGTAHAAEWETWERVVQGVEEMAEAGLEVLAQALTSEAAGVRALATRALPLVPGPKAQQLINQALADVEAEVRCEAIKVVARLLEPPIVTERMLVMLQDQAPSVQAAAARLLGERKTKEAQPFLRPLLHHPAGEVRLAAAVALAQAGNDFAPLMMALQDSEAGVRAKAAEELSWLRDRLAGFWARKRRRQAVASLIIAAADQEEPVRLATIQALSLIGHPDALPVLRQALGDASDKVRQAALYGLKDLHAVDLEQVVPLLTDSSSQVRATAAYLLGEVSRKEVVPALLSSLGDEDQQVQITVIQALRDRRDRRAVPPLVKILQTSPHPLLRTNALRALEEIGDAAAVPALIEALQDPNPSFRQDAARVLGVLRDERAVAGLAALLTDHTTPEERDDLGILRKTNIYTISETAQQALERIGTAAARSALQHWRQSGPPPRSGPEN